VNKCFLFSVCVFFSPKKKKKSILQKRAEREEREGEGKAKTYTPKVFDRSSEEAHAHTLLRAHTS
jgi:hypothetical protein|tara:strand:+ start:187 stop:381 length:195 start_codon:yes stop_codon:yes gene_type:complete